MALLIQFYESKHFKSPVLYIHSDENEAKAFLIDYVIKLKEWQAKTIYDGFPLGRLEPSVVMVDFLHKLTIYYMETTPAGNKENRVLSWLRLYSQEDAQGHIEGITKIEISKDIWHK